MQADVRLIAKSGVGAAHDRYLEVFGWLSARGVRQWLRPVPRETFEERQGRGELFGCFVGGRLAAVVTLALEAGPHWTGEIGGAARWWIKSLAVAPEYHGGRIGARTMSECERLVGLSGGSATHLDCVDAGFLPGYYAGLGYVELARKNITYPSGNEFLMVLMRKSWTLPPGAGQ